jgi:hypothetical protein
MPISFVKALILQCYPLFKKRGMVRLGIWSGGVVLVFVSALRRVCNFATH